MSLRSALRAGRDSLPFYGTGGQGTGTWRFLLPGSKIDYEKVAGRVWDNAVANACIGWIARTWQESTLHVERPVEDDEGQRWKSFPHPLTELIERPNEWYDDTILWMGTILSLVSDGNAYWFVNKVSRMGEPNELVYLPHHQVEPASDRDNRDGSKLITHYEYTPTNGGGPIILERGDVIHLRDGIDPFNPRKGMSRLKAAMREIATENEAATYSAALLRNFGIPGAVFVTKENLGEDEVTPKHISMLRDGWDNLTGEGRGRLAVIPLAGQLQSLGMKPKEMELGALREVPMMRICAAIGIDPLVMGFETKNKTYSNVEQAKRAAYESCLIPMKRMIASQLTTQLLSKFGERQRSRVGWDYSQVSALQDDQDALFTRYVEAYARGVIKRSEAKNALGLEFDASDEIYVHDAALGVDDEKKKLRKAIGQLVRENRARAEGLQAGDDQE